jgi:C4-dicarboxylate-specific signal transduction histidine kinase
LCQNASSPKQRAALILLHDQPIRPANREYLDGIQEATRDAIGLTLYVEFHGSAALETEAVAIQRRKLLANRYAGQPIELLVAIGDRILPEAERLRTDLFPSARLLFLIVSRDSIPAGMRQGEGLLLDMSPLRSIRMAMTLMPEISRLVVISGTSSIDELLRKALADSLRAESLKAEVRFLSGLPLPELLAKARSFPPDTLIVLTSSVVDRSGRVTSNADQARELAQAGKAVVEATDLSLGQGSLGGDITAFRLSGQELGRRIRRTLDTGQAPAGVVIDPAPRRKSIDWRQLKRLGIPEGRVPSGFELLYRQPTVWEEHRAAILAIIGGLLLQTVLISFLLNERRRRGAAQAKMKRQLDLEARVSKASADLSAATNEDLPATLRDVSAGLADCLGIERVSVWMYEPGRREYMRVHFWPESETPWKFTTFAQAFPYVHNELESARNVVAASLEELPLSAAQDVSELRKAGLKSLLGIPLKLAEKPIGALFLTTFTRAVRWESEAVSTLQVLSDVLAQDISRSMAEERARHSDEQSRAMLASLPGFVLMIDGTGQILKQNNRLELDETELPRALAHAYLGKNLLELWRADGEAASHVAETLEQVVQRHEASLVLEYRYETDRGTRWLEVRAESLSGQQKGVVVSQTDITGRKKIENENAQNRQTAWHLNRVAALGELTASLAHEINQPLAAILNSAEAAAALLNRPSPDIAETMEAIRDIINDDKRAGAVIGKMRSMLKRSHERTQAVDLNATVSDTLRLVSNEARLRHVILRHIEAPGLPSVVADPTQLQQVILNLITNGIEAAETMPDNRRVEIGTSCLTGDGMQVLEVRDSGPGIPAGKLTTIFEPFYTSKRQGLGLGLSICRSIVDSFGGRITVESPPDGGAVFRVFLRTFVDVPERAEHVLQAGI